MGDETLLTDLCAICHAEPIKYTCPRCGIHTCALPCVKRHKTWAQCSGIRDPAAFRKRSELATAASIDQDFNFITNVERSLQKADDVTHERGLDLTPAGTIRPYNQNKSRFEVEAEANGIIIVRAPKGMSRSKQNKSQFDSRQKRMTWTIEWILPNSRQLFTHTIDTRTVIEAYQNAIEKKATRKRPRDDTNPRWIQEGGKWTETTSSSGFSGASPIPETDSTNEASLELTGLHFFLHRPNVPSNYKCLIPIARDGTIAEAIRKKTILEFPTVYVRLEASDDLVIPFISEANYIKLHGSELPVALPSYGQADAEESETAALPDTINDKKVLEVLQKDIRG